MKIKITGLIMLLGISCGVGALGFKGISVDSFLNEPLDARITLVSIEPAEAEELRVALAPPDAFENAGLIRPYELTRLRFKTLVDGDRQVYVHVTTQDSVREPFLNFLLEFTWGENRLLHEVTILLDPPSSEVRPAARKTGQARKRADAMQAASVRSANRQYGPVERTETLWVIAERTRPGKSLSIEQMMMALLKANPHAFQYENVNFLKQGAVLDIPDQIAISELSASSARRAFLQQIREWKDLKSGKTPAVRAEDTSNQAVSGGQSEAATREEDILPENTAVGGDASLRLVEADKEPAAAGEEVLVGNEKAVTAEIKLSDELEDSRRDLEAVREINRDLVELKDALELKIEALRKSLEERNRSIEELEQRLNEVRAESRTTGVQSGQDSTPEAQQGATGDAALEVDTGREEIRKALPPEPVVAMPKPTGWLTMVENNWLQILVAVLLLLVLFLLFLLVRRRRLERRPPEPEVFGSYVDEDGQPATEEHILVARDVTETKAEQEDGRPSGDFALSAKADVASALTDADIYLAYRRYGHAEELIKQAIGKNPENMILKAKLLEIYAFRKDRRKFVTAMEAAYQSMIAHSPELWAKVQDMGRTIVPDHELIAGAAVSERDPDAMVNDLSIDLDELAESNIRNEPVDSVPGADRS